MASTVNIGGNGLLFVGTDVVQPIKVVDKDGIPVNIAGFTLVFDVRKKDTSPDPAILSLTPAITGIYNVDPLVNTQVATVTITDTQMNLFKGQTYRYSLKRNDNDSETILVRGDFIVEKATAP